MAVETIIAAWTSLKTVIAGLVKYGPAVAAFLRAIQAHQTEEKRLAAATDYERGFRVLTETKSPKALQDAILKRCGPDGCLLP